MGDESMMTPWRSLTDTDSSERYLDIIMASMTKKAPKMSTNATAKFRTENRQRKRPQEYWYSGLMHP